jgi:hypothetical protein
MEGCANSVSCGEVVFVDEAAVGRLPFLRVRSATDEDLERDFGSSKLVIGFPVTPRESTQPVSPTPSEQPTPD